MVLKGCQWSNLYRMTSHVFESASMERGLMAAAQRVALQLPPRRAASECVKMPTILRAEGGQLQAPVSRQRRSYGFSMRTAMI